MSSAAPDSMVRQLNAERMSADLPVLVVARRAFYLPVRYPLALIKLGAVPALLTIAIQLGANAIVATGVLSMVAPGWILMADTFVYVPFAVGWTRLAMDGPARVAMRGPFHFRRAESHYLLAIVLFSVSWLVVIVPLYLLGRFARRTFDHQLAIAAGILMVGGFFALAICLIRSLFILPAAALNQYKGIAAAWRLSKCSLERLLALEVIVHLPYAIALMALARMNEPYYPLADRASIAVAQCIVWMFGQAFVAGGIALAYQHARAARPDTLSH